MTLSSGLTLGLGLGLNQALTVGKYQMRPAAFVGNQVSFNNSLATSDVSTEMTLSMWFRINNFGNISGSTPLLFMTAEGQAVDEFSLRTNSSKNLIYRSTDGITFPPTDVTFADIDVDIIYHLYIYLKRTSIPVIQLNNYTPSDFGYTLGVNNFYYPVLQNAFNLGAPSFSQDVEIDIGDFWVGEGLVERSVFVSGRSPKNLGDGVLAGSIGGTPQNITPSVYVPFYSDGRTVIQNLGNGQDFSGTPSMPEVNENWMYEVLS